MKKILLISLLSLLLAVCFAHEYILLAAKYRLQKGDDLEMHLFVADGFNIEMERPFQKAATLAFELLTNDAAADLSLTENGKLPIIYRKVDFEGGGLIHLERNFARIALSTEKFLSYLKEDHMKDIIPKVDLKKKEQRERYTRYVKSLVQSGAEFKDTLYKRIIGQNFEIILLQNPYQLKTGNMLSARVFFMGKPLVNKTITARNRTGSQPPIALTSTTDANGICSFQLSRNGEWFIHATHMIPCPDQNDSDWESFWASYSFAVEE